MKPKIYFHSEETSFKLPQKRILKAWIEKTAETENKQLKELNIIFCNDTYLHKLNVQYLNHDTLTDIITFDYSEKPFTLGDLFISIERVKENAKKFNVDFINELHRVIIHGTLHLLGYKDKKKEDKAIMKTKEDKYLEILKNTFIKDK
jgi:probable rRNA maturation factor